MADTQSSRRGPISWVAEVRSTVRIKPRSFMVRAFHIGPGMSLDWSRRESPLTAHPTPI